MLNCLRNLIEFYCFTKSKSANFAIIVVSHVNMAAINGLVAVMKSGGTLR